MTDIDITRRLESLSNVERHLPIYPVALFQLIGRELELPRRPLVVDLGAGSGRASLPMARLGWQVTAVDPDSAMLDLLNMRASIEGLEVTTIEATAESTSLDEASVHLVIAAHAFHWFDMAAALMETARITRPGGGVALFWNVRDRSRSPIIADYYRVLDRYGMPKRHYLEADRASGRVTRDALARAQGFEPARLYQVRHEMAMQPEDFVQMALNVPYVRGLTQETRTAFRDEIEELLASHRHTEGRSAALPYVLNCWIAKRSR